MFLMFLIFPHTQHSKLKPHHYNKYKNKYNKTVQCPTTKQYNVPQKHNNKKMNKNTKWTKTQQNKKNTKQKNTKQKKPKSHQNPQKTKKSTQKTPNKKQTPHKPNRAGVIQKITLKIRKFKNSKIIVHSSLNN